MTDIQNVDSGNKFDLDRVFGLGIVGLLWKRHAIFTVLKYSDDDSKPQTIVLDFIHNTKYAQPLLVKKMHEVNPPIEDTNQAKLSIADELSKLAKLKEQGVITEEEFTQMKRNLMEGMKDH
jgi:hypothetical protein